MRLIALPMIAIALAGASEPPVATPPQAVQSIAPPKLGPPTYLQVQPFRDEIFDVAHEMQTAGWHSLGGAGSVPARRKVLLSALATAQPDGRQRARWNYARFLIDTNRGLEASAVLDAMAEDEPTLRDHGAFQGVRAIALVRGRRYDAALSALNTPALVANPDACLWRSLAHSLSNNAEAAMLNWPCAVGAANRLSANERLTFALPIIRAAYTTGNHELAENTIDKLPRENAEVMFWRGFYAFRRGETDLGKKLLAKVRDGNNGPLSSRAELELVNALARAHLIKPKEAVERLDKMRFAWRGGMFERDLLLSLSRYEEGRGNIRGALAAAAPLIRYMEIGHITSSEIARVQRLIGLALGPASPLSLSDQAGVYWDYRDLAPQGLDGDQIIRTLADKIAAAGLHRRAADLLERQIRDRLDDAGPSVAVRAAQWRLLAGQPAKALAILEETNDGIIPADVRQQRQLLYLYSLLSLGRGAEAMAILDGASVGLSSDIRAELYWQGKEWAKYMALNRPLIEARAANFNNEVRAMVVRQAIAASLSGNEGELQRLATRYSEHFPNEDSPLGPAFRLLTGAEPIDEAGLKRAMADIDKAAPANIILGWVSALSSAKS